MRNILGLFSDCAAGRTGRTVRTTLLMSGLATALITAARAKMVRHSERKRRMLLGAVLSVCAYLSVANANLVQNGSFETPISDNQWTTNPATWFAGQTFDGYWYVGQGSIDIGRFPSAYHGDQFLDLNGSPGAGSIYQDIVINSPGLYQLRFAMNGNYGLDPNNPRTMVVSFGTLFSQSYTHTNGQPWLVFAENITVSTPDTYRLQFTSTTTTNIDRGPYLDGVELTLVPEPASVIALGSGLVSLLALRRRRVNR